MTYRKRIIVIGGGPAGVEAALTAARAGAETTLVSDGPIGGRATWHSLLPSKVWLTAADLAGEIDGSDIFGIGLRRRETDFDPSALLSRLAILKNTWSETLEQELLGAGVEIIKGLARFVGERTVEIAVGENSFRREADFLIVATGSIPWFPDGLKPDGNRVIAPRLVSHLKVLPSNIAVIGAGPTGSEFVYLFNQLGVAVTWIVDPYGVLPQFHLDAGQYLADTYMKRGVKVIRDATAIKIDRFDDHVQVHLDQRPTVEVDMAFVAIGRRPDFERLNLESAGLSHQRGDIQTDGYGRTENPAIYLAGDANGGWMVANKAMAQGHISACHALGLPVEPYDEGRVMLATYTNPQIAQIGVLTGAEIITIRGAYDLSLKARLLSDANGFIELAYRQDNHELTGGLAAGAHAVDVLAPVAVALSAGMTIDQLGSFYIAHPTLSELAFLVARRAL